METYDVILVLGKKLTDEHQLIDGSKSMVEKAVELFNQGRAPKVIFSGRWYFKLDPQPITEAAAMAKYAKELGLPESAIILEEQSDATITNIYFSKINILEKHNWKKILLINHYPFNDRAMMTAKKILGPEYRVDLELTDYVLPEPKHSKYIEEEKEKRQVMIKFYKQFKDGDHQAIYEAHLEYLKKHNISS